MRQDGLLEIRNLTTRFFTRKGIVRAVEGVDLAVRRGTITGLVGESGCGKSVTALSVMGLVPSPPGHITAGRINLEGENLLDKSPEQMAGIRGKDISMIFQEPMTSLNPVLPIGRQVAEPLRLHTRLGRRQIRRKVVEMLELVGIPDPGKRLWTFPHQLSGGLRQRVMIAMAMICEPKLLIADEPTTALDVTIQAQILDLMKDLMKRLETSIILITHDLGVVAEVCDDVYVMYAGKVVEQGSVFDIFDNSAHPYTLGLLRSIPRIDANWGKRKLHAIEGTVPNLSEMPAGCPFAPRCEKARSFCREKEPPMVRIDGRHFARCHVAGEGGSPDG
jgi:peptide/nickel transport system ATP-binding protein/oligopeptide transport system ATP-binding protein